MIEDSTTGHGSDSGADRGQPSLEAKKSAAILPQKKFLGINPLKIVFAMEYVMQGLANPFQGITYQPFFKHFRYKYGLSEAATQTYFSRSYLAWSFKPIMGFFIDAFGKTKVILTTLLGLPIFFYFFTPFVDINAAVFFGFMFTLSMILAATDVAVDRATVIVGDEESKSSGKSKATTVGLNQAICWASIYGTCIVAAISGGYVADNVKIEHLMYFLSLVPLSVLIIVLYLPKDRAVPIPILDSVTNFWQGLNTGPILWIIFFYFLFHFQPAMGVLWTNHLIENLHFSQTQVGFADGAAYLGNFLGVILFATFGIRWQDKMGLRRLFKIFILGSVAINLTQYLMVDPWFSRVTVVLGKTFPFIPGETLRLCYLSTYNLFQQTFIGIVRLSTFSLVGAVISVSAAGSLFAGFMSISNLAYAFSYASGAWLYENGLNYSILRNLQQHLFGLPAVAGTEMSINLLIYIGSMAYLLSFAAAHMLPNRRQTLAVDDQDDYLTGPEKYNILGKSFLKKVNQGSIFLIAVMLVVAKFQWQLDWISSASLAFFGVIFLRKLLLDWLYKTSKTTEA